MNISTDEYPTANEVSMAVSRERMPLSLTKFICWLLDKKSFQDAAEHYLAPHDKIRKIMGVTERIFSISKDVLLHSILVLLCSCTTISDPSNLSKHCTPMDFVLPMEKSGGI
jgi:hypothetical protein